MKHLRLFTIYTLLFNTIMLNGQSYTIRGFNSEDKVKKQGDGWRFLSLSDENTIELNNNDSIFVTEQLLLYSCKEKDKQIKNTRVANSGIWSVKQIWKGQALPKKSNCEGPAGEIQRGQDLPIAVDFITTKGVIGNTFTISDSIYAIAISNISKSKLYITGYWASLIDDDYHFIPILDNVEINPYSVETVLCNPILTIDAPSDDVVYVFYSNNRINKQTVIDTSHNKKLSIVDYIGLFAKQNAKYGIRSIQYYE